MTHVRAHTFKGTQLIMQEGCSLTPELMLCMKVLFLVPQRKISTGAKDLSAKQFFLLPAERVVSRAILP